MLGGVSTCLCWLTDHNKHVLQRQVMTENTGVLLKWEGRRHLEKPLSAVCHFCLIRWVERVSETKTHTSKTCCHRTATMRHSFDAVTELKTDSGRWWNDFRILPSLQNTHLYTGILPLTPLRKCSWWIFSQFSDCLHLVLCCFWSLGYTHKMVLARFRVFGEDSLASQWDNWGLIWLVVASVTRLISSCTRAHCSTQWDHSNQAHTGSPHSSLRAQRNLDEAWQEIYHVAKLYITK